MKYKQLVKFIKSYFGRESFDTALEHVIGVQMNKERLDIYEKILIYCPELSDKSKKYINERIETNKTILKKREKAVESYGLLLEKEKVDKVSPDLDNFLENRPPVRDREPRNYGTIAVDEGVFTMPRQPEYTVTATANMFLGTDTVAAVEQVAPDRGPEPTWQRAGTGLEVTLQRRTDEERDERTVREYSRIIRSGGIRLEDGQTYAVGLSNGRIAYLNNRGTIVEVR